MSERTALDGASVTVEWEVVSADGVPAPIVRDVPYLELKLEHRGLEPTGYGDRFFPNAVPYAVDGTHRVWYWRPGLPPSAGRPSNWEVACATTHELAGIETLPEPALSLVTDGANGVTVVVDGTVGGDVATDYVQSYAIPNVSLTRRTETAIELVAGQREYTVEAGERRRIQLPDQRVEPVAQERGSTTVTPELAVRYPGQRELHHPAIGAEYRVFPSFGLDLDAVPNPISVPTAAEELDHAALAAELGVDRSARPYPERVLWQAFAYTAFDPHADTPPELTQLGTGHILVWRG